MSTNTDQNTEVKSDELFALKKENYKLMLIGIAIVIIGFLLMLGGGSEDPNVFNEAEIFSARRITIAPITVLIGYGIIFHAILKKEKPKAV